MLNTLRNLEEALLQAVARQDSARVEELLHDAFEEIGRSGQRYGRAAVLRESAAADLLDSTIAQDFRVALLAEGIALLTYVTAHINATGHFSNHTRRSSFWLRVGDEWRLRFHQGTPAHEAG